MNKFLIAMAITLVCAANHASAQSFSVSSPSLVAGSAATVDVDWSYTAGGTVDGFVIDIVFDDDVITPQTTPAGLVITVDDCIAGITGVNSTACNRINDTTIRVTMLNESGVVLPDLSGTITFDIGSGAAAGDSSALALTVDDVTPAGASISTTNGLVSLTAGPAGALTIAPTSHNFGTLLTGQGTATQAFTVTNSGDAGSTVALGTPTVTGAGMSIVSGNTCASATLAKDESCSVTVQFTPADNSSVSGALTIAGTDGNDEARSASATLSGAGETKAIFRSTPAAGSTQTEVAGAEGEASFTISLFNDGNASYAFTSALTSGDSDIFTITGGADTVAAFSGGSAGSSTITVSCELPDFETYEGTVTVTVGDETYEYGFTCVGRPPLPVPTMSVWSLSLMALMLMLMAGFGMRTMRARR